MSELSNRNRILIIDSGGGYGGPGAFLQYLLKYLDKDKFQPVVAFYFYHASPETQALQEMGVPVLFLSRNRALAHYLQSKFLSGGSKWKWLNLTKELLRFFLLLILIDVSQVWRLLSILKRNRIDLIVLNNDVHYHRVAALAARISGIPCICRKAGGIGEGKLFKKILTPWIDLFIAISAATSRDQLENNPATKRMVTIFEGVDLKKFDPSSAHPELRTELGIPADRKVVGYISRLVEGKGHNEFVEAAVSIVRNYKDVVFLIVGNDEAGIDGPSMKCLKNKVQLLGLADYFIFAGWRTDIPQILSILDVFVHCPTTWIEGLGIAHLEAMAMAKPTVVSQNGGLPDAAVDGRTGFIVPPGDIDKLSSAILRLLRDQELASRLGRNARQRVEELFDVEKNTRKLEVLFEEYSLRNQLASKRLPPVRPGSADRALRETVE